MLFSQEKLSKHLTESCFHTVSFLHWQAWGHHAQLCTFWTRGPPGIGCSMQHLCGALQRGRSLKAQRGFSREELQAQGRGRLPAVQISWAETWYRWPGSGASEQHWGVPPPEELQRGTNSPCPAVFGDWRAQGLGGAVLRSRQSLAAV